MHHWTDPRRRGIYSQPSAVPPRPAHPYANDISVRLARVEEHQWFQATNIDRVEHESRLRAADLGSAARALDERLSAAHEDLDERLAMLEQDHHTRKTIWAAVRNSLGSVKDFVRYVIAGLFFLLLVTGNAHVAQFQAVMKGLGFGGN